MEMLNIQTKDYQKHLALALKRSDFSELASLLKSVYSDPDSIKLSFTQRTNPTEGSHNLDIPALQQMYKQLQNKLVEANLLLGPIDTTLLKLKNQLTVKSFVRTNLQLRAFLIIMLYPKIYDFENRVQFIRLAHALYFLSSIQRSQLINWMCDFSSQTFLMMVEAMQTFLSVQLLKLIAEEEVTPKQQEQEHYVMVIGKFMDLIFQSNCIKPRINKDAFKNQQITTDAFDPYMQLRIFLRNIPRLHFIQFPFLLDIGYKQALLECESFFEQEMTKNKVINGLIQGHMPTFDHNTNFSIDSIIHLSFQINRHNILDDSIQKLAKTKQSLKKKLKISFVGEPGNDDGGVQKQYFQLVIKQIFNPNLGMFVPKNNNTLYWFNGDSFEPPINFEFMGTLLGLSIYNSILLDLKFPKIVYKKLMGNQNTRIDYLSELQEMEPQTYKSLMHIMQIKDQKELRSIELNFQCESESFGSRVYHELIPGGQHVRVTLKNRDEYCRLYAEWILNKHVEKQFNSFKKGFFKVVTGNIIKLFYPQELEKIICGQEKLDFYALQNSTHYQGFTQNSLTVVHLWEILHAYDINHKKAFLFFSTGSDRAPIQGLGSIGLTIQRQSADTDNLPTSHTCSNVFLLPDYSNKQKLRKKLELALHNNQGFGLI